MMEASYDNGLVIQMADSCNRTGWPIDISMQPRQSKGSTSLQQPQAIYFML